MTSGFMDKLFWNTTIIQSCSTRKPKRVIGLVPIELRFFIIFLTTFPKVSSLLPFCSTIFPHLALAKRANTMRCRWLHLARETSIFYTAPPGIAHHLSNSYMLKNFPFVTQIGQSPIICLTDILGTPQKFTPQFVTLSRQLSIWSQTIADRRKFCDRLRSYMTHTSAIACDPAIVIADDRRRTQKIEPCSIFCDRLRSSAIVCDPAIIWKCIP